MATASLVVDPTRIMWLKNVVRRDGLWAYCGDDPTVLHPEPRTAGDEFFLHWPTRLRANASEPAKGEVIVLVQDGHVTHLVEVVDDSVSARPADHHRLGTPDADYAVQRRVRALVLRGHGSAPTYAEALGFTPWLQGGACCRIEHLQRYCESEWPNKGGIRALQAHLIAFLARPQPGGPTS